MFDDKGLWLMQGDCIKSMRGIKDKTINCCITSPPYFGLRDYGVDGQIGLEQTPEEYVTKMVDVFREVRRVLRDDGTLWLNIGDSYAGSGKGRNADGTCRAVGKQGTNKGAVVGKLIKTETPNCKPKDLIGIPWMLAFALRADGWYLRQEIIWHKPNPMPESVKDRCTKAHEQIFLLSKSERYYFDSDAMKEDAVGGDGKRNRRSVWNVPTSGYKGAHFATFPPALIEPCVMAGCPVNGIVLDPFGGSGTTAGVAIAHERKAIICELNEEYTELIPDRITSIVSNMNKI